jgi:transcriptional regulator with XRE-family HTH domain
MRRAIRLDRDLTQQDEADAISAKVGRKVHRETVARWESGDRTPRGDLLLAYVELLDDLRAEQP